jgi:hemoglobin-like flavoprotein
MTSDQIESIQRSFDALWPGRRKFADVFYSRFFELAPDARPLFPSDMERQQLKLMDMLAAMVGALDERELFQSLISHTGRQHATFGVRPSHYSAFREALVWSFSVQFGAAFTPDVEQAWLTLYGTVEGQMLRASHTVD